MIRLTIDPFKFTGKLLELLQYGGFTSTYKYAVLLGLLDLCVEFNTRGDAPTVVTTNQLAHKVIEIYWPQTWPFTPTARARGGAVPEQIKKREFNSSSSFGNRISLEPEAAHTMVRIAARTTLSPTPITCSRGPIVSTNPAAI